MENGNKQQGAASDAFGQPHKKEEIFPADPGANPEEGKEDEGGNREEADITKDPRVQALLAERDAKINEQGEQLSGQGKAIREINRKLKALGHKASGGEDKPDLPHKEIRRSRDLTDSERDEKTQEELRLMDQLADAHERENKAAIAAHEAKKKGAAAADDDEDEDDEEARGKAERDKAAEPKAMIEAEVEALSGGDPEKKRELREAARLISFDGLKTKEEYAARLKLAAEKLIPKWSPPKEQPGANGKAVEAGGTSADDPYDVMKFVKQGRQAERGNFSL